MLHHPNGNPGTVIYSPSLTSVVTLWTGGYIVAACTGADNGGDYSGATSSHWGATAGLVYRRKLDDYIRTYLPQTRDGLYHLGLSMGAISALAYERYYPNAKAIATVSGAVDLSDSFTNRGFATVIGNAYGTWYLCIQAGSGHAPASSPTYWRAISSGRTPPGDGFYESRYTWRDMYAGGTSYAINDVVCVADAGAVGAYSDVDPVLNAQYYVDPPVKMWHGTADTLIPLAQMTSFSSALTTAGGTATTVSVSGGTHLGASCFDATAIKAFFDANP